MGLFKSIKKAFKKVGKAVKKVVKKVVGGVKKVVKKISSSKILKALAIAGAIIITGGAALTAFGSTTGLAATNFGSWMMSTSQSVLGGTAFGSAAGKSFIPKVLTQTGNFVAKVAAKPFGAVGGAVGSTARVGANIFDPNQTLFQSGPAATGPKPFSGAALSGTGAPPPPPPGTPPVQTYAQANPGSLTGNKWGDYVVGGVGSVIGGVATGYAQQELLGEDPRGVDAPLMVESKDSLGALQVYASNNNFNLNDIYGQLTYGTADPGYIASTELYTQDTIGVPS